MKGFVAITTVLILSVVVVAIAATVTLLSIGEAQSSLSLYKGEDTLDFVEGCAEDGLLKSRADSNYNGGSITRPEGTCSISISKAETPWTMTVSTSDTKYQRTIEVKYTRNPTGVTLSSWKEV